MPFPSMPIGFWNDPDGRKYHAAYFERFPGVWTHGDYCELTEHDGVIIYGRSDAVFNPGGVRIGTAEIYRQVEQLPDVVESLVIGQQWEGDERIVLFVRLRDGLSLDEALDDRIRAQIRGNTTPSHVPARIVQVTEIPRTKSGKIVELAVRDVVHGRDVKNREALANPEALESIQRTGRSCSVKWAMRSFSRPAGRPIGSFGGALQGSFRGPTWALSSFAKPSSARISRPVTSATSSWAACCRPAPA